MSEELRILLAEDRPTDAELTRRALSDAGIAFVHRQVDSRAAYLRELEEFAPDIVISDYYMPQFTGMDALELLKEHAPAIPLIIVTGSVNEETAVDCMKAGAVDYVMKENLTRLGLAVEAALDTKRIREEKQRYEDALWESARQWRATFDAISDAVLVLDLEGRILRCNRAMRGLLERPWQEVIGSPCWGLFRDATIPLEDDTLGRLSQDPQRQTVTLSVGDRWFRSKMDPVADEHGNVVGAALILVDITGRKRAEDSNARLAAAVEHAAEAIVVTDATGDIEYVNPAFEQITGYAQEEALGKNPRILQSGQHDPALYGRLWKTITGGAVWSGRFTNQRKDGTVYEEAATISAVYDSAGDIAHYVAVKRDITEELSLQGRLRQAQKLEAIGTLAGGIAHDFNNVLAAIIGYGQMAKGRLPTESPLHRDLHQVLEAADRAKDLVREILTFSRRGEERRQEVKLHHIVKEALKLLEPALPATIEARDDIDRDCPPVLADPTQIHQVVMNLCTNAYQAMREDGGALAVGLRSFEVDGQFRSTHPDLPEGLCAELTVSDTGHGMDAQVLQRAFDPFFTTKPEGEGTGLGLATTHGIVKAHGGDITVYSEPNQGTTVRVYLPCAEELGAAAPSEQEPIPGGTERILVVDDEENLAQLMEQMLRRLGYDVLAMTSSAEALATFRDHPDLFDLVITDQTMPEMTGCQLAEELLRIRPGVPVVLTTGFSETVSQDQAEEMGIAAFLMKPATTSEIAQVVRRALDGARARVA